jgi:hypothetical protein
MTTHSSRSNIKQVLYFYYRVEPGRPWAQNESPGSRCCQRHGRILGPVQSLVQTVRASELGSDPNPFTTNAFSIIRSYVTCSDRFAWLSVSFGRQISVTSTHNAVSAPPTRIQNAQLYRAKQQTGGGQPGSGWFGGGGWESGVCTTRSRHPRRRVPDPDQSMNPGWIKRRRCGDQNPTDRYVIGKQNTYDIFPQLGHSTPSVDPLTGRSRHREVGR